MKNCSVYKYSVCKYSFTLMIGKNYGKTLSNHTFDPMLDNDSDRGVRSLTFECISLSATCFYRTDTPCHLSLTKVPAISNSRILFTGSFQGNKDRLVCESKIHCRAGLWQSCNRCLHCHLPRCPQQCWWHATVSLHLEQWACLTQCQRHLSPWGDHENF
jgi:hypothetical protein